MDKLAFRQRYPTGSLFRRDLIEKVKKEMIIIQLFNGETDGQVYIKRFGDKDSPIRSISKKPKQVSKE